MNFFEMLVMSRKLSFVDGKVSLYGQGISIYPARSIMDYMGLIHEDSELVEIMYETAKASIIEYKKEIIKASSGSTKIFDWLLSTINLYGLGKVSYVDENADFPKEIIVTNSPFVQYLKGKIDRPVDNVVRGIMAGMLSAIFDRNYDIVEIECEATGGKNCRFIIDTPENIASKFPEMAKTQI